jgi:hypothetical protein
MNILICGTRGVGKSTLALHIAKGWNGTTVIFDPRGSFDRAGIPCYSTEEMMEHLESGDYAQGGEPVPLVVRVDGPPAIVFDDMCANLFPHQFRGWRGRLALIVDESRNLQSSHQIQPSLDRIVGQAPINDVLIIQTTHEIKEWNSKCKSVMDECLLFYQKGPMNYKRIEDLCDTDCADAVEALKPRGDDDPRKHWFIRYSFSRMFGGREWILCDDPTVWHSELGQQNRLPGNREEETDEFGE